MATPKSNTGIAGIPPGGPWFVGPTGTIQRQSNPVLAEGLVAVGWIGFATNADATTYAHTGSPAALVNQGVSNVKGAISSTTDILSRLTSPALWLRVAEVGIGLILIAVGVAKLTNAVPAATKLAKAGAIL